MKTIETIVGGVSLRGFLHERINDDVPFPRPSALVLPGGGYESLSRRESEPVMLSFLSKGYQAFTLDYTTGRENIAVREPEREVAEAILWLRENSDSLDIDSRRIVLIGFSAGGHLALSQQCHIPSARSDALVLCYPVVTTGEFGHNRSSWNIAGDDVEKRAYYSLETQLLPSLPPVFMWHTSADRSVHPMNTLLIAEALSKMHVPFEYHLFEKGKHGLSICTDDVSSYEERTSAWLPLMFSWLEDTLAYRQ